MMAAAAPEAAVAALVPGVHARGFRSKPEGALLARLCFDIESMYRSARASARPECVGIPLPGRPRTPVGEAARHSQAPALSGPRALLVSHPGFRPKSDHSGANPDAASASVTAISARHCGDLTSGAMITLPRCYGAAFPLNLGRLARSNSWPPFLPFSCGGATLRGAGLLG